MGKKVKSDAQRKAMFASMDDDRQKTYKKEYIEPEPPEQPEPKDPPKEEKKEDDEQEKE